MALGRKFLNKNDIKVLLALQNKSLHYAQLRELLDWDMNLLTNTLDKLCRGLWVIPKTMKMRETVGTEIPSITKRKRVLMDGYTLGKRGVLVILNYLTEKECGYCFKKKKQVKSFEAPNGEAVPICKDCCKSVFKWTFRQLEEHNRRLIDQGMLEFRKRNIGHYIVEAIFLAQELQKLSSIDSAKDWLMGPNPAFQNYSPFEEILEGNGKEVIQFLKERLGRRPGSAF